ncbi:uncharacterized protein F5891DRAFT_1186091 [Suillus fuscotomentosus]|uniref:Cytochrome P450 n=1 Tax=Suillus fuscotomentosus TaxID=1912939 RepID=A0AAD4EAY6_9AGAM|nr:uncharacterized protein F5891DRAFT_1186091 [Suillus fuscotomentosus]KAG1902950.1 hypothetical protein F5891DRAFT_1186091 [Suillus fuscotomentosus]
MFAGSDMTSLALTWTFLLLAKHPDLQTRLHTELLLFLHGHMFLDNSKKEANVHSL